MLTRLFPLVALTTVATACSQSSPERPPSTPTEVAAQRQKAAQEFRLAYSDLARLDSLSPYHYQFIGLTGTHLRESSRLDSYGSSSASNEGGLYFNVAFFQPDGTDAHLLLPHSRFRITDLDSRLVPQARAPYLFYSIITTDLNRDGRQDAEDRTTLFASDRLGRQLRQVTSDSTDLIGWQIMPPHYLVAHLRLDSNHDSAYTYTDAVQWLRYDLRNLQAPPAPLIPAALQQTLRKQLIDRHLQLPNEE